MKKNILFEVNEAGIATLTLNMPETRNAITRDDILAELIALCQEIAKNNAIRVLIVTGAGEGFSSGGNVFDMKNKEGMFAGDAFEVSQHYRNGIQHFIQLFYHLEVPVISAINGAAVGAGLDFALAADLRIASSKARFGSTFVNLGIIPGDGGAWFLPRIIGAQRAAELILTGKIISAQEALALGMVLEVVEPEALMPKAYALAEKIAAKSAKATRLAKRLLRLGNTMELPHFLETTAIYQGYLHQTAEHEAALNAFLNQTQKK